MVFETEAQHLGDSDHVLADGDLAQNLLVDVFGKERGAFWMARPAEASPPATKRQQKVFAARRAPQAGKTTAEVTTIEILCNDVPDDGAPEAVLLFVTVIPDALELVEVVPDRVIERRGLGISRPLDSLRIAFHMESNCPRRYCANAMLGSSV